MTAPATFDMWGPTPPKPTVPRERSWGLGDLGWALLWFMVSQVVLTIGFLAVAAARTVQTAPAGAPIGAEQVQRILDDTIKIASTGPGLIVALLGQWLIFVGMPLWATRKGNRSLAVDFGFRFHWKKDLPWGVLAGLTVVGVFAGLGELLSLAGVNLNGADNTGLVTDNHGVWLLLMCVFTAIGAPLVEELFFRGLIMRAVFKRLTGPLPHRSAPRAVTAAVKVFGAPGRLMRRHPQAAAVVVSGMIFGLLHFQSASIGGAWLLVQTCTMGLVFGAIAMRTGRLGPTIVMHATNNTVSVILAVALSR